MAGILYRLKLKQPFELTLDSPISQVVEGFTKHVDYHKGGAMFDFKDLFSPGKNLYKGHIEFNKFKIRRKWSPFHFHFASTRATGQLEKKGDQTLVKGEVNGVNPFILVFFGFVAFFYLFAITMLIAFPLEEESAGLAVLPFMILHGFIMVGLPYFFIRRSVTVLGKELEREFYYMTR